MGLKSSPLVAGLQPCVTTANTTRRPVRGIPQVLLGIWGAQDKWESFVISEKGQAKTQATGVSEQVSP